MRIAWPLLLLAVSLSVRAEDGVPATTHALCDTHAAEIFDALDASTYDKATAPFDAPLRERYPASKLKADYEALPSKYGKLIGRGRPHVGDVSGHTVVMAPLIFEHGTLTAEVHCGSDGGVSDFRLLPTQVMTHP